jgi:hypothetical protein
MRKLWSPKVKRIKNSKKNKPPNNTKANYWTPIFVFRSLPVANRLTIYIFSFLARGKSTDHIFFSFLARGKSTAQNTRPRHTRALCPTTYYCNQSYIVFPNRSSRLRFSQKKGFGRSVLHSNRIPSSSPLSSLAKNCSGKKCFLCFFPRK